MLFIRGDINRAFKRGIFPYIDGFKVEKESDENDEIDTTDIPDLESEESTVQRKNQQGQGLKTLTPNQMLSRLPISLAQLKEEIILRNLKTKLGYFCILCTDRKSLQKMSIIIWSMLFKNRNNLYEHWKQ